MSATHILLLLFINYDYLLLLTGIEKKEEKKKENGFHHRVYNQRVNRKKVAQRHRRDGMSWRCAAAHRAVSYPPG